MTSRDQYGFLERDFAKTFLHGDAFTTTSPYWKKGTYTTHQWGHAIRPLPAEFLSMHGVYQLRCLRLYNRHEICPIHDVQ